MDKQEKQEKMSYAAPQLTVVTFKIERGYAESEWSSMFMLGRSYFDSENDAWSGDIPAGTNSFGGWTDNGGSAWD